MIKQKIDYFLIDSKDIQEDLSGVPGTSQDINLLADSIRDIGIVEPLRVLFIAANTYQLLENADTVLLKACKLANVELISCIVVDGKYAEKAREQAVLIKKMLQ